MKKFLAFLILTALIITMFTACGRESLPNNSGNGIGSDSEIQRPSGPIENNTAESVVTLVNPGKKTGIKLPCSTKEDDYIITSDKNKAEIEGITSKAAILVDMSTGKSNAEKEADTKIYPASMTKVMTILVAAENAKNANEKLTVTKEMVDYQKETGGSTTVALKEGDTITVEDALYLINYTSDTVACLLIAEYVAETEEDFVELMNEKAEALGLEDTHFVNTTGLHDPDHYTTCREMAAIMQCALNNETANKIITGYKGYKVNITNEESEDRNPTVYANWYSGKDRLSNKNYKSGTNIRINGGKTGYEDIPTACFVTYGKDTKSGDEYICVVVGRIDEEQTKVKESPSTTDTWTIYKNYAK